MARAFCLLLCVTSWAARAEATAPTLQAAAAERTHKSEPADEPKPLPIKFDDEAELDVLTFHRSNYLLSGFTQETQVKFQFSFKYDLWPSSSRHTVYLAYTQKSLWDLYDKSSPFRESNYAPEIFYAHYHSDLHGQPSPGCGLFAEKIGVEHESNGEASDASRSWNRVFVDVVATCYGKSGYGLLGLRAWYPLGIGENKTITRTQGYGELLIGIGVDDDVSHMNGLVSLALRKGTGRQLRQGSITADARWRPTYQRLLGKAWKFAPYLWVQYFAGFGETLGTFDSASQSVRLGVGFTDRAR